MLIRCGLLILLINCVKTTEYIHDGVSDFSLWPSVHNAARLMRVRREDQKISAIGPNGISEGDTNVKGPSTLTQAPQAVNNNSTNIKAPTDQATNQGAKPGPSDSKSGFGDGKSALSDAQSGSRDENSEPNNAKPGLNDVKSGLIDVKSGPSKAKTGLSDTESGPSAEKYALSDAKSGPSDGKSGLSDVKLPTNDAKSGTTETKSGLSDVKLVASDAILPSTVISNNTILQVTNATQPIKQFDLNNPGVVKRGFIVFSGFALLAVAYYIFYRRKGKNNSTNTHNLTDTNQFRYGVLQSEDKRDTELSRIPLTMESDDDDEEDLEIFDLEQKKKSLSYVNLQTNDEDVVFSLQDHEGDDGGNLLLDIEDGTASTLINWSSNGNNKSIL